MPPVYFKNRIRPPLLFGIFGLVVALVVFVLRGGWLDPAGLRPLEGGESKVLLEHATLDEDVSWKLPFDGALPAFWRLRFEIVQPLSASTAIEIEGHRLMIGEGGIGFTHAWDEGFSRTFSTFPHLILDSSEPNEVVFVGRGGAITEVWINRELYFNGEIPLANEPLTQIELVLGVTGADHRISADFEFD